MTVGELLREFNTRYRLNKSILTGDTHPDDDPAERASYLKPSQDSLRLFLQSHDGFYVDEEGDKYWPEELVSMAGRDNASWTVIVRDEPNYPTVIDMENYGVGLHNDESFRGYTDMSAEEVTDFLEPGEQPEF